MVFTAFVFIFTAAAFDLRLSRSPCVKWGCSRSSLLGRESCRLWVNVPVEKSQYLTRNIALWLCLIPPLASKLLTVHTLGLRCLSGSFWERDLPLGKSPRGAGGSGRL